MSEMVKRRIQYTVDEGIAESAEYIMAKAGVTPATLLSMLYSEINNTGKIPVYPQVSENDALAAKLIAASYNVPSVKLDNQQAIDDFMDDDGGY